MCGNSYLVYPGSAATEIKIRHAILLARVPECWLHAYLEMTGNLAIKCVTDLQLNVHDIPFLGLEC